MDTALVSQEVVALLSRITGQKLSQRQLTPPVIFLAALVTVLLGVMFADGTVTDEEKQRWQKTINRFIPSGGNVRQLTQLLTKGIRQNQIYKKLNDLLTLTAPLSQSERLLLIGFGYEMSAADGDMNVREKKYLEVIANKLGLNPQHLAVLEAGFTNQETVESDSLDEVQALLAPARFQELNTLFVKAASDMLAALPAKPQHQETKLHQASSYQQLQAFQKYRKQLDNLCYQIFQIVKDCTNRSFIPDNVNKEIGKVSRQLQSEKFRLAVVGEFSQGKSTLLNALLGEEIQPVREIPCSGTVTVLRYGVEKRAVCCYRDGREEEIPFEQYQDKATLTEEAALGNLSEELAHYEIDEIVFEHPDLDLCSSGVEIIDSPGLNEHPNRTAITQKLLKNIDAAIFLTNASRSLTQGERGLLQDLKFQLNSGVPDQPADNLFVVGNFMDLVQTEKGREQVKQRIERFVLGQNPVVTGKNRLHFISAQSAFNAILQGTEDEYLKAFRSFTQAIEKFLTVERLGEKLEDWSSEYNPILNRDKLIEDYDQQFNRDLSKELDSWIDNQLKETIIQPKLEFFDDEIKEELQGIKSDIDSLEQQINTKSSNWVFYGQDEKDFGESISIWGDLTLAGLGAALFIPTIIFAGPILTIIGSLVSGGMLGTGIINVFDIDSQVKAKVFEVGCEKFVESLEDTFDKISEIINSAFYEKVELADEIIRNAISFYENLLEQQEKAYQETLEQREIDKSWIAHKRQELERLQNNLETYNE